MEEPQRPERWEARRVDEIEGHARPFEHHEYGIFSLSPPHFRIDSQLGGMPKDRAFLIAAAPTMRDYIEKRAASGDEEASNILRPIA